MTGVIIAIVVVAILAVLLFAFVLPRSRAKARERETSRRRGEVAGAHRERAEERAARADVAEHQAARERAEAELHETRARLHERGMADDELDADHERLRGGEDADAEVRRSDRFDSEREAAVEHEERR
jgi:Flp pilus assembly protein TadB